MNKVQIIFRGPFACFTRPECKADKLSYEVITPSAARNMLQAIHWKPAFNWRIEEIHVLEPIRFVPMTLNEISTKNQIHHLTSKFRDQTRNMFLKNVAYGIVASVEMTTQAGPEESPIKHLEMFRRRAEKGQSFTNPYLGLREFLAEWELLPENGAMPKTAIPMDEATKPLGPIFYDFRYVKDPKGKVLPKRTADGKNDKTKYRMEPVFFNPVMINGVIKVEEPSCS
jgi:CRISPR-associated protein Cas5d